MYFWRLSALSHALAHERVPQGTSFLHCFFTMLYVGTGLVGASLFPALYLWFIQKLNLFTTLYVSHGRPIAFFNEYNAYIDVVFYMSMVFSFWYCFYANQSADKHDFLQRFWTLSWPVLVRATVYTFFFGGLFFLLPFVSFYLIKLLFIALMSIKTTPDWILKIYNNVESGGLSTSMAQLRLIKALANTMNYLSWLLYISSGICTILHLFFFTRIMSKSMRLVAQVRKEKETAS